nr:sterol uptake control protein 2 [Quercus suber]
MPSKREHTKSRLGCAECKRRRIKCNEVAPRCGPCTKKGIVCEYSSLESVGATISILTQKSFASPTNRSDSGSTPTTTTTTKISKSSESPQRQRSDDSFSPEDMLLMHHFTLHTSRTIGILDKEDYHDTWQRRVPQLAYQERYLMHAVLALAAAHRSDFKTARHHYGRAINAFTACERDRLSAEHADSIFCYCVLIMLITLALESEDFEQSEDPIIGVVNFFNAARTATPMLSSIQPGLEKGEIQGLLQHMRGPLNLHDIPADISVSLDQIDRLMHDESRLRMPEDNVALSEAMANLRQYFRMVTVKPSTLAYILQWPLKLSAGYLALLQEGDPVALAMLCHWCVPLYHAPQRWFCGDWAQKVILMVVDKLEDTVWRHLIAWPRSQLHL